jgi:hypothetical protein
MHDHRSIFRQEALRRYQQSFERGELPRFIGPRHIALMWLLVVAGLLCSMAIGFARVPNYAPGYVKDLSDNPADGQSATWVILTPARHFSFLRAGQTIVLYDQANGAITKGRITQIKPQAISMEAARIKFNQSNCALPESSESLAVAFAEIQLTMPDAPTKATSECWRRVEIEIGAKPLGAFLPFIGSWYE